MRVLRSFPTRRSSDLGSLRCDANLSIRPIGQEAFGVKTELKNLNSFNFVQKGLEFEEQRSEEHTSELQSRFDLVCRLLLEKKNLNVVTMMKETRGKMK